MFPEAGRYFEMAPEGDEATAYSHSPPNDQGLADAVRLTVTQYSDYQGKVYAPMADKLENTKILEARTGLKAQDFSGSYSLDAGCGAGRMTRVISEANAKLVVGFDAGHSIDEAKRLSSSMRNDNIEWVQGDILRAPFKTLCFDRVISIGVLHHTSAPDLGFRKLAGLVKAQGSLSVYLYAHAHTTWDERGRVKPALGRLHFALLTEPFRRLIVRLPGSVRMGFCRLLWVRRRVIEHVRKWWFVGGLLAKAMESLTPQDVYKPLEDAKSNIARNFDTYSTPYNYRHDFTEVIDWFEKSKRFGRLEVTPYRLSVTGLAGVEPRVGDEPMHVAYREQRSIEEIEAAGVSARRPA